MSIKIIQQRLSDYNCKTDIEEQHAIREITQELVLAALGRGDFFKHALFQGGTCLRIFYGLNRFSEDMDFILREADHQFELKDHIKHLTDELAAYGYNLQISDRNQVDAKVKKAFLKDYSVGKLIEFHYHLDSAWHQTLIERFRLEAGAVRVVTVEFTHFGNTFPPAAIEFLAQ